MPDPAWYPTQAELERKVGGAFALVELSGSNTGVADSTFVDSCLMAGRAAVRGAVMVKHTADVLDALDAETTADLRRMAVIYAARAAWSDGAGGQAMPPVFETIDLPWAAGELEKISTGRRFIGGAGGKAEAALRQPVGVVVLDPLGQGVSIEGFKRGFR